MNDAVRELWKAALISGDYEQGRGVLRNTENRYCCLGVLCDLYIKETGKGRWVAHLGHVGYIFRDNDDFDSNSSVLTSSIGKWAGLESADPKVLCSDGEHRRLSVLNDDRGATFSEIAELLDTL